MPTSKWNSTNYSKNFWVGEINGKTQGKSFPCKITTVDSLVSRYSSDESGFWFQQEMVANLWKAFYGAHVTYLYDMRLFKIHFGK